MTVPNLSNGTLEPNLTVWVNMNHVRKISNVPQNVSFSDFRYISNSKPHDVYF